MLSKDHALMNIEQQSPKPSAGWNKHPTIPGHLMYFRSASKWVFKKKNVSVGFCQRNETF